MQAQGFTPFADKKSGLEREMNLHPVTPYFYSIFLLSAGFIFLSACLSAWGVACDRPEGSLEHDPFSFNDSLGGGRARKKL